MLIVRVVEANWRTLRRSWRSALIPAVAQPLVLMIVFAGLLSTRAQLVVQDGPGGNALPYPRYVALGIACSSAVVVAVTDAANSTFTGFRFGERFRTAVTTPVSPLALALGMLLWAFVQGALVGGVLILLATPPFLGVASMPRLPIMIMLIGLTSASVAAPVAALVGRYHETPQILNITGRVILAPLVLFSATYFPTTSLPAWARVLMDLLPLAHANTALREVYSGSWAMAAVNLSVVALWVVLGALTMARSYWTELTR